MIQYTLGYFIQGGLISQGSGGKSFQKLIRNNFSWGIFQVEGLSYIKYQNTLFYGQGCVNGRGGVAPPNIFKFARNLVKS